MSRSGAGNMLVQSVMQAACATYLLRRDGAAQTGEYGCSLHS